MGVRLENHTLKAAYRWIKPYLVSGSNAVTSTFTAGRVFILAFEINEDVIVDGIGINNFATIAGNVTAGIYGPLVNEEAALNAPLAVQSASTAHAGANLPQLIPLSPTLLRQGRYYTAIEFSDATATVSKVNLTSIITSWTGYYDRGGGYGALTDPCPAVLFNTTGVVPIQIVRCQQ
jgi:hypothetical protein